MRSRTSVVVFVAVLGMAVAGPVGAAEGPVPLESVDWAAVVAPVLDCGSDPAGAPVTATVQVSYVQPAPQTTLAVVLAACSAGPGRLPSSLSVFDQATSTTSAHLLQVLVDPGLNRRASSFTAVGPMITMSEEAWSSSTVEGCCPDLFYTVTWTWAGGAYVGDPAAETMLDPLTVTVTASAPTTTVGGHVTYVATLTNTGSIDLTDLLLWPVAPQECSPDCTDAMEWVSGSPGCSFSAANGSPGCSLGVLHPGESSHARWTMHVTHGVDPLVLEVVGNATMPVGNLSSVARVTTTVG